MVQYNCLLKFKSAAAAAFTVTVPAPKLRLRRRTWASGMALTCLSGYHYLLLPIANDPARTCVAGSI